MAVQFIVGRSGTGKTSYCVEEIVKALSAEGPPSAEAGQQPLIFLVPEQATYQAERAILSDGRITGYSRLAVLSFERLGFLLSGKNAASPVLSRVGQEMIIHRILQRSRDKLKLFGRAVQPGLAGKIAQSVVELQRYAKTPEDIDELVAGLGGARRGGANLSALKFADIGFVYREYLKFIEARFVNPDIQSARSKEAAAEAEFIKGARLWVDGFSGFTAGELELLAELFRAVSQVKIALCLDPREVDLENPNKEKADSTGLFYPTQCTYAELVGITKKCKLSIAAPVVLDAPLRFRGSPALEHIERNIFGASARKIAKDDSVQVVAAQNARAEVEFIAKKIVELVKQRNYRWRDIAVVASDIGGYQHYIEASFADYEIPFFIDRRRPIKQHPLVGLVRSGLRAVADGWGNRDIFGFLKSDLATVGRYEVDMLENYCLAFGVGGADWKRKDEWRFAAEDEKTFDQQQIDKIRRDAVRDLIELEEKLGGQEDVLEAKKFVRAIWDFIERVGVKQRLSEWTGEALEQGDFAKADEHREVFNQFVDVLDELAEIFADVAMAVQEWLSVLEASLWHISFALIPPKQDQVLVGSIERSRHPELKAVFLAGASQRRFPVPVSFENILTDQDRCAAERQEFFLAETTEQQLTARQYLAYIAFTRPAELLWVTYPLADEQGSALCVSEFVTSLEELFEDFPEGFYKSAEQGIEAVGSKIELLDLLCSRLGRDAPQTGREDFQEFSKLLEGICCELALSGVGNTVCDALNYDNSAKLDEDFVGGYFGDSLRSSATRLSTFAACPYKYFAKYTLGLKEREVFKFEPLDLGVFYHRVLHGLFRRLRAAGKDFAGVGQQELLRLLSEEITSLLGSAGFYGNFAHRSAHNEYILSSAGDILEDFVLGLGEMTRAGRFRPIAAEFDFYKEIKLSNGRSVRLVGRIDRIDAAKLNQTDAAVVFDYKRKAKEAGWGLFYYGLDMQLPVYLLAIEGRTIDGRSIKPIGAFYIPVETSAEQADIDKVEDMAGKFKYKAKGFFNGEFFKELDSKAGSGWSGFYNFCISKKDGQYGHYRSSGALRRGDFEKFLEFGEKKIKALAEEIMSGKIDIKPYQLSKRSACNFCEYRAVCRFDWQINNYNLLRPAGKSQVLEEIRGRGGE